MQSLNEKKKRRTCREIYFVLTTSRVKPCPRLKISMSELDILFLRRLDYSKLFFCQRRQKINSILNSLRYRTRFMFSEKSWDSMLILSIWFFSLCLPAREHKLRILNFSNLLCFRFQTFCPVQCIISLQLQSNFGQKMKRAS